MVLKFWYLKLFGALKWHTYHTVKIIFDIACYLLKNGGLLFALNIGECNYLMLSSLKVYDLESPFTDRISKKISIDHDIWNIWHDKENIFFEAKW